MRIMSVISIIVGACNDAMYDIQKRFNNAEIENTNDKRINENMIQHIEQKEKENKALRDENIELKNRLLKSVDDVEMIKGELYHKQYIQSQVERNEKEKKIFVKRD